MALTVEEKAVAREIARDEAWVVAKAVEESNRIARALEESVGAIAATQKQHGDATSTLQSDVAELKSAMRALINHFAIEIPRKE